MFSMLQALWNYRGFIFGSIKREFQLKYRNSMLGAAWTIIDPLTMIVVYTVIFSQMMHSKLPDSKNAFSYSIYLCAGVLTWNYFSEITGRAQNVFLENANLLKKINFPRICLPFIVIGSASLNFIIIFALFSIFLLGTGNFPGVVILSVIPVLLLQIAFSIGLGMTLGVLNVFFRDVGQFYNVILQFWFWLTPIVYSASILPDQIKQLLKFNPMAQLIAAYQAVFVSGKIPDWYSLWPTSLVALFFCISGVFLFAKHGGEMVDEL